jgi:hypothetical protein
MGVADADLDRAQIEQLILAYATFADRGDGASMAALFGSEPEIRLPGRTVSGEKVGRFFGAVRDEAPGTLHVMSNIVIDADGSDRATSVTYFQVLGPAGLQAWGRYVDEFRRTDGGWRIAVREVDVLGSV